MTDKAATDKASITAPSTSGNVIAKYLPVYFALLAIAGLEIFLAYRNFSVLTLLVILLAMAICGAVLAVMYFMHLAQERPSLFLSLIPATIFVLFMMNAIWTDSFRLLHMKPFAH
ncbi:MAG TPA: cytochrome C oxidase subunit IV family protein [Candidatus Dormibacteraeota bacterium]|jgi:cytochrome c oxidase subunit IV|nr:cytochrome C oxidase subunit IV family protein [Candidatus Dormibacteraeota bacterium]